MITLSAEAPPPMSETRRNRYTCRPAHGRNKAWTLHTFPAPVVLYMGSWAISDIANRLTSGSSQKHCMWRTTEVTESTRHWRHDASLTGDWLPRSGVLECGEELRWSTCCLSTQGGVQSGHYRVPPWTWSDLAHDSRVVHHHHHRQTCSLPKAEVPAGLPAAPHCWCGGSSVASFMCQKCGERPGVPPSPKSRHWWRAEAEQKKGGMEWNLSQKMGWWSPPL